MTDDRFEILSAFVDGEPVDPGVLAELLALPGARETLIDFVLLRAQIREDSSHPGAGFYRSMERAVRARVLRFHSRTLRGVAGVAAAAVLVTLGLWVGHATRPRPPDATSQPPLPQREIPFEFGVDWRFNR